MTGSTGFASPPVDADAALRYVLANRKPADLWRVGIEYEVIGFDRLTRRRMQRDQVQVLLRELAKPQGVPVIEGADIIAVHLPYGDVTLEPGGQIEFSGLPEVTLARNGVALRNFIADLHACAAPLGIFFIGMGFDPLCGLSAQSWIRKQRYTIMRPYLAQHGAHAWDMMTRTAATQTSIDYSDEEDLGQKYVLGNRLGPIVAAMFANSPFAEGKPSGLKSTRYAVWLDTDPDRSGPGPGSLDEPFELRAALGELLDVPMFFVTRNGKLRDVKGSRLAEVADARIDDVGDLLSMIFTEARIRQYVEMRSADSSSPQMALALAALWKGLTYDRATLREALALAPRLDRAGYRSLQTAIARDALDACAESVDVGALAKDVVALAIAGLGKVAPHEMVYLDCLAQNVIEDGVSPADILLRECSTVDEAVRWSAVA